MAYEEAAHADHHAPHVSSFAIFMALCVCTALSWLADEAFGWGLISSRKVIAVLVLAIAVAKAQFVMRYFMHLKFEGRWKYVLLLPTAILACGLPLALAPDIAMHYYTPETDAVALDIAHEAGAENLDPHEPPQAFDGQGHIPSHELTPGEGGDEGADQE